MKNKLESLILIVMPVIAAFNYVVAHRLIGDAQLTADTRIYEEFYFIVVSTGIFHLFWLIMILLIFMRAF